MLRTEGWSLRKRGVRYIIEGKGEPDMDVKKLLEQVRDGVVQVEDAQEALKNLPYEDLGYAKLDHHRKLRSGFGETVFCQGKPDAFLLEIYKRLSERDGEVLGTRASEEQHRLVKEAVPQVAYDPISRILKVEKEGKERKGLVAVCTGCGWDSQASVPERTDRESQLHCGGGRDGGSLGNCACRSGRLPGGCGAYLCGVWGQLSWAVGPSDNAELLRQWDFGCEY